VYSQSDGQAGKGHNQFSLWTIMVWSEVSGQSKALTNFSGPLYVNSVPGARWSNDGQDSFVSFGLFNPTTGQAFIYRAHVSAADIASTSYQPITTINDPRLEYVAQWLLYGGSYWWNHEGTGFYYVDPRARTNIRLKTVGVGVTMDDDPIVYSSTADLFALSVGPPVDPLNPDRYLVAGMNSPSGILALDLVTSTSWLLATQAGTGFSWIGYPVFSPDGSAIAFGAERVDGGKKPVFHSAVYRVPFFGGPITQVTTEFTLNGLYVNNWYNP
jgi:hypothetical protein